MHAGSIPEEANRGWRNDAHNEYDTSKVLYKRDTNVIYSAKLLV